MQYEWILNVQYTIIETSCKVQMKTGLISGRTIGSEKMQLHFHTSCFLSVRNRERVVFYHFQLLIVPVYMFESGNKLTSTSHSKKLHWKTIERVICRPARHLYRRSHFLFDTRGLSDTFPRQFALLSNNREGKKNWRSEKSSSYLLAYFWVLTVCAMDLPRHDIYNTVYKW